MCQKAARNLFGTRIGVLVSDLTWTRGEPSKFYSSEGVARGFCANCGTPLFYHNEESERVAVSIGAFDSPSDIALAFELGIEGKLPQVAQFAALENFGTSEDGDPEGTELARRTSRQHPDHYTDRNPPIFNWGFSSTPSLFHQPSSNKNK
ncbi:MAG: GFA family protein, partial [Litorivicinus sp.]